MGSEKIKEISQSASCVPDSSKPTAKCWKIKLMDETKGGTPVPHSGIEFHVKVDGTFQKGTLSGKGESGMFSAEDVKHEHVYFNLKIDGRN